MCLSRVGVLHQIIIMINAFIMVNRKLPRSIIMNMRWIHLLTGLQIISGIDSGGGLASRVIVLGGYGKNKLNTVELITDGKTVEDMPSMIKPRYDHDSEYYFSRY